MERWNGGMVFFSHPFCLLVCLLTIIPWLSFRFACFYFQAILFLRVYFASHSTPGVSVPCFETSTFLSIDLRP